MELLRYFIVICLILYADTKTFRRYDYEFDEDAKVWFKLHRLKATWHEARDICHQEGAIMASPLNKPMKDALQSYSRSYNIDKIFVGVHATFVRGVWNTLEESFNNNSEGRSASLYVGPYPYPSRSSFAYANEEDTHCGSITRKGGLVAISCYVKIPFLCEKKVRNMDSFENTPESESRSLRNAIIYEEYLRK